MGHGLVSLRQDTAPMPQNQTNRLRQMLKAIHRASGINTTRVHLWCPVRFSVPSGTLCPHLMSVRSKTKGWGVGLVTNDTSCREIDSPSVTASSCVVAGEFLSSKISATARLAAVICQSAGSKIGIPGLPGFKAGIEVAEPAEDCPSGSLPV